MEFNEWTGLDENEGDGLDRVLSDLAVGVENLRSRYHQALGLTRRIVKANRLTTRNKEDALDKLCDAEVELLKQQTIRAEQELTTRELQQQLEEAEERRCQHPQQEVERETRPASPMVLERVSKKRKTSALEEQMNLSRVPFATKDTNVLSTPQPPSPWCKEDNGIAMAKALGDERRRKRQLQATITTVDNDKASPNRVIRAGGYDQHLETQADLDARMSDPASSRILAFETLQE